MSRVTVKKQQLLTVRDYVISGYTLLEASTKGY